MNTPEPIRAPRLTDKLLRDDLPCAIETLDAEIEYLASRLTDTGAGAIAPALRGSFATKHERLQRARDWLAGKVAAETHHRTED